MQAKDIMTTPVVSVTPQTRIAEVARLLLERHISAVPVLDKEAGLVGMISEGDFLRRAEGEGHQHGSWWLRLFAGPGDRAADFVKTHGRTAADVMTREVISVAADTPEGDIAHLLETRRIKRVPVVSDGKVIGIVSRADLLHSLAARRKTAAGPVSVTDDEIRKQVLAAFRTSDLVPPYGVSVIVVDAVVQIWGFVEVPAQGNALRVAAENTPGVKGVELNVSAMPALIWE